MTHDDRIVQAERRLLRTRVEVSALRDGTIEWLEGRADSPDLARTPNLMAGSLGISPQAANNRLRRLWEHDLATRRSLSVEGGGIRYAYKPNRPEQS